MKHIIFAFALMLVLVGSAVAQSSMDDKPGPFWQGFSLSVNKMEGFEASTGILDKEEALCWGRTFTVMNETGVFTLSVNYNYARSATAVDVLEPNSSVGDPIVSGTWTMVVYKGGELRGMLFGDFTGGTMTWTTDKAGNLAYGSINGVLNIKGGTHDFAEVGGTQTYGRFNGFSDYTTKNAPFVTGSVDLMF